MRRSLTLTLITLAALAAWPAAAPASPQQAVSFEAPRELLDWTLRDGTLDEIRAFGVTQIRQLVIWRQYAPRAGSKRRPKFDAADSNAYPAGTWDRLDALIDGAAARGISVQLTLTGPVPKWASGTKRDYRTSPSTKEFRLWAQAVGARYGSRVSMWSIWNEPNQYQFLTPQYVHGTPASPRIYRGLYQAGVAGLRKSADNRKDTFLIGELSPRGNSKIVHPLDFVRRMLCLSPSYHRTSKCGKLNPSGFADHAYTTAKGPRYVPANRDDVTIGVLSRLVRALDRAARAGALPAHLPIYLTEFGIQSYPDRVQGVSLARQAAYMAIAEHMAYVNPRVRLFSQYLMRDDNPRASPLTRYAGFESGLRTSTGKKKPAYDGFRLPLAVESYGASDVLWGLVRPDRATTQVTIQADPPGKQGWHTIRTLTTTATGVYALRVKHRASQRYRVQWTSPGGQRFTGAAVQAY